MKLLFSSRARPLWALLFFVMLLLPLVVFLSKHSHSVNASGTQAPVHLPGASSTKASAPDFQAFTGIWIAHGRSLTFAPNGKAQYGARVYIWCGPGVSPPCDTVQNHDILDGIADSMLFTHVSGNTAYGTVIASTDGNAGRSATFAPLCKRYSDLDGRRTRCWPFMRPACYHCRVQGVTGQCEREEQVK
jgi:hypothetical protein